MSSPLAPTACYWFGRWLQAEELPAALQGLSAHIDATLPRPFPLQALVAACHSVSRQISDRTGCYPALLREALRTSTEADALAMLQAMAAILDQDALHEKLRSELGSHYPGTLQRRYPGRQFEAWAACGCVVHIAPSNVFTVAALGLVEGLLTGNVNVVKTSARDGHVAQLFAQALVQADVSGHLADYIAVLALPSSEQQALRQLMACADAVSAWGGEKAMAAVRSMVPGHARLIAWGHKVSFAYLAADSLDDDAALEGFARDVCRLDQQACSSPQTLMAETDEAGLHALAQRLAALLTRISPAIAAQQPDSAEQAEITSVVSVVRSEQALGLTRVIEDPAGGWRILLDTRPGLRPSPLFRSIWLKPVQRSQLAAQLRPMRAWLQTCGLAAGLASIAPLARLLLSAGVTRITRPGEMVDSYLGAPHDGMYALQQLARRVSVDGPELLREHGQIDALEAPERMPPPAAPILSKAGFQALEGVDPKAGVIVRSGGSSGKIAYAGYRWSDFDVQMATSGDGLVAAGLEPGRDCVMNLLPAGSLYGGFISFWGILERLKVRQLPMAMSPDYDFIAEQIIAHGANTLIGVPPHLLALFKAQGQRLRAWGGVQKIFYGGEALSGAQQRFLTQDCGVALVRSAAYGSNDAGPMGYQCAHGGGGVHHLYTRLQTLEIVELDSDTPVQGEAVGRLIFTPLVRGLPRIERYEIGDLGRWLPGPCACGRQEPRFELLGRLGDVFKAGPLMRYDSFVKLLGERFAYPGPVQLHLHAHQTHTELEIRLDNQWNSADDQAAIAHLLASYPPLQDCQSLGIALALRISVHEDSGFTRNPVSGKIIHICDHRVGA
ncbi:acyl-CoA reductase [Comamonas flocculans]|nr:acyl-CoA reductase [Comamonas flocculans]